MLVAKRGSGGQRPSGDRRLAALLVHLCNSARRRPSQASTAMPQTQTTPTVTPNLFQLSGHHLHITYSPSGVDGKPSMTYQDSHQSVSFKSNEIRTVECDVGILVSVTLRTKPDV